MTGVLSGYLRRRVGLQILALTLVLTALMQVLELLDVTTEILDRDLGIAGLFRYALLRTPAEIVLALPLAVLLGAMSALYAMARNGEMIAIRCAGVSLRRILVYLLPVPLLLALLQFFIADRLVPRAESALKIWWDTTATEVEAPDPIWVRTSTGPLSFERTTADGLRLKNVRIYQRGNDGLFSARITAELARWDGRDWQLENVRELRLVDGFIQRTHKATQLLQTNLRPDDVLHLEVLRPTLSSMMLVDVIAGERVGAQPRSYYETVLLRSFTAPLALFIMLLLAVPPAREMSRGGGGGGLLIALGLGLGFLLCDGIMAALGTSGRVPAYLAALAAPLLFTAIGFAQVRRCDRT